MAAGKASRRSTATTAPTAAAAAAAAAAVASRRFHASSPAAADLMPRSFPLMCIVVIGLTCLSACQLTPSSALSLKPQSTSSASAAGGNDGAAASLSAAVVAATAPMLALPSSAASAAGAVAALQTGRAALPYASGSRCSRSVRTIAVWRESDVYRRTLFPPSQTVRLVFYRGFALSRPMLLRRWSCTIFTARNPRRPVSVSYRGSSAPALTVYESHNLLFVGISLRLGVGSASQPCRADTFVDGRDDKGLLCPTLYVTRSYGIQYTMAAVYGRIDVFRSVYVKLDSLYVTGPRVYARGRIYKDFTTHGLIRVGECSTGSKLLPSRIVISNCEVRDSWELITLYRGAVGVTVKNNYLHNYDFTAIRCGADVSYVMDCHLSLIADNFVYSTIGDKLTGDSAGIYFCTHWFNPGNRVTCNYVIGGEHCYYFDISSSAITVEGGLCLGTVDGFKINGGKFNHIRSMIMVDQTVFSSFVSCQFAVGRESIHCYEYTGNYWDAMRQKHYSNLRINRAYPFFTRICPAPTHVEGKACNPRGSYSPKVTGKCSGLGYDNEVDVILVNSPNGDGTAKYCGSRLPAMDDVNWFRGLNISRQDAGFNNWRGGDYGVARTSRIRRWRRGFKSCPRSKVGPAKVNPAVYMKDFNIPRPYWYIDVLRFDMDNLIDFEVVDRMKKKYGGQY